MGMSIVWMMDDEFCCNCGTALNYWESDLCFDCQQDEWYGEDQDYYDGWESDWDVPIEEAGQP
jgi:hypothetical protein